jgi:hypothetical protein
MIRKLTQLHISVTVFADGKVWQVLNTKMKKSKDDESKTIPPNSYVPSVQGQGAIFGNGGAFLSIICEILVY